MDFIPLRNHVVEYEASGYADNRKYADEHHHHKQKGIASTCSSHAHLDIFAVRKTSYQKHCQCSQYPE